MAFTTLRTKPDFYPEPIDLPAPEIPLETQIGRFNSAVESVLNPQILADAYRRDTPMDQLASITRGLSSPLSRIVTIDGICTDSIAPFLRSVGCRFNKIGAAYINRIYLNEVSAVLIDPYQSIDERVVQELVDWVGRGGSLVVMGQRWDLFQDKFHLPIEKGPHADPSQKDYLRLIEMTDVRTRYDRIVPTNLHSHEHKKGLFFVPHKSTLSRPPKGYEDEAYRQRLKERHGFEVLARSEALKELYGHGDLIYQFKWGKNGGRVLYLTVPPLSAPTLYGLLIEKEVIAPHSSTPADYGFLIEREVPVPPLSAPTEHAVLTEKAEEEEVQAPHLSAPTEPAPWGAEDEFGFDAGLSPEYPSPATTLSDGQTTPPEYADMEIIDVSSSTSRPLPKQQEEKRPHRHDDDLGRVYTMNTALLGLKGRFLPYRTLNTPIIPLGSPYEDRKPIVSVLPSHAHEARIIMNFLASAKRPLS